MKKTTIMNVTEIDYLSKKRSKENDKTVNVNNNNKGENEELDSYDATLPPDDPTYMRPLRKWEKRMGFKTPLIWTNILLLSLLHIVTVICATYYMLYERRPIKWQSFMFVCLTGFMAGFSITGGAHRLWTHRSYKAKTPLKLFLLFCYSVAGQYNLLYWVRDHRVHHKFSETVADPHDANRGFFFAHIGWFMMKRHPAVLREGQKLDFSDITDDPIVRFHIKYHDLFKVAFCFVIPTIIPVVCWGESWGMALLTQLLRFLISLHNTWAVNSFAHMWGNRPYDKNIMPAENWIVSILAVGEGWHNYHHTFPWDYKAAEMPYTLNPTTFFIDCFAKIGWAYNLRVASPSLIDSVVKNRN